MSQKKIPELLKWIPGQNIFWITFNVNDAHGNSDGRVLAYPEYAICTCATGMLWANAVHMKITPKKIYA